MHRPVKHRASARFWQHYHSLPQDIRRLADGCFDLLKRDDRHPSLHFKKVERFRSIRVGSHYRALAVEHETELVWFWIGSHADYDKLLGRR